MSNDKTDEALNILMGASEALSHASYCGITGTTPNHGVIVDAWDPLRKLINAIDPKENRFLTQGEPGWVYPTIAISDLRETLVTPLQPCQSWDTKSSILKVLEFAENQLNAGYDGHGHEGLKYAVASLRNIFKGAGSAVDE